jgi:phenylalanyl-tRNA synthetase alpha subunit
MRNLVGNDERVFCLRYHCSGKRILSVAALAGDFFMFAQAQVYRQDSTTDESSVAISRRT